MISVIVVLMGGDDSFAPWILVFFFHNHICLGLLAGILTKPPVSPKGIRICNHQIANPRSNRLNYSQVLLLVGIMGLIHGF